MAGNSLALAWDLIARDNASPTFLRVSSAADKAASSTEAAATKTEAASARINRAVKTVAIGAVAGVAALGVESLKMAADFQTSTTRLVTSANESQKNLAMVQRGILTLSGQVGDSAEELSAAMYKVESGGQHGAAGLEVLKAAAQGAKAENADLTTVADAVTSAMQDYHLQASQAADVTSKLVAATASGKMTFEELAASLSAILPLASANHVSLNDILGDLASMTIHGMSAEQASQNLADTLRHLAAPTQQQSKELAALGLSATDLAASLGQRGVSGSVEMVAQAIEKRLGSGSTQIILDLNTALAKLPPNVRKLGEQILDGTISLGDYRKAMKALPAEQAIAAQSFMSLVSSTHQLGSETKTGSQVYQSYSGALRLALGDATSMNTALMLTGENTKTTTTAIQNVTKATADAKGNVKGWSEIQDTFNVQMQEFGQKVESSAIGLGMKLLPAATDVASFLNRNAIPAIEHMGSGIEDSYHWWTQLPAPIKDTSLALAGLLAANKLGLLDRLASGAGSVRTAFAGLREEMTLQQHLWAMEQQSAIASTHAYSGVESALGGFRVTAEQAAAGATGLEGKLSTLAVRGMAGLKAGATGLMSLLGGPWGVALGAGTLAISGLVHWLQQDHDIVPKVTVDTQGLTSAIQENNGAIDGNVRRQAAMALQQAGLFKAAQAWGVSFSTLTDAALGNKEAIAQVNAAEKQYHDAAMVAAKDTGNLSYGAGILGDQAYKVAKQSDAWASALAGVTGKTEGQIAKQQQINQAVGAGAAATSAATDSTNKFAAAAQRAGADVAQVWGNNTVVLRNATGAQIDDLEKLGGVVRHLPDHQIVVSADTQAARDAITRLTNDYHNYSINLGVGGIGARYARAGGGPVYGPGSTTSDSIPTLLSNREWVIKASSADRYGSAVMSSINDGTALVIPRRAAGGPVTWNDMFLTAKVGIDQGSLAAAAQALRSVGSVAGAPGNVNANAALAQQMAARYYGWTGPEWNALYAVGKRESGWNNLAQNPTSTAFGIGQFLDSTWATVGLSKTSNPAVQIAGMLKYIAKDYRDPIGALRHEQQFGWYDNGGWLMPGATLAFNGTGKPERIRTAEQEAALGGGGDITVIAQFGDETIEAKTVRVVNGRLNDWYRKKRR